MYFTDLGYSLGSYHRQIIYTKCAPDLSDIENGCWYACACACMCVCVCWRGEIMKRRHAIVLITCS